MTPCGILATYRLLFSALIVVSSLQTLLSEGKASHGVAVLAGVEIIAALLLSLRRSQWPGAWLLLGVFAAAQLMSAMNGEWPTRFLQYSVSALLIVTMDRALTLVP